MAASLQRLNAFDEAVVRLAMKQSKKPAQVSIRFSTMTT
jgi:hypothetical protein